MLHPGALGARFHCKVLVLLSIALVVALTARPSIDNGLQVWTTYGDPDANYDQLRELGGDECVLVRVVKPLIGQVDVARTIENRLAEFTSAPTWTAPNDAYSTEGAGAEIRERVGGQDLILTIRQDLSPADRGRFVDALDLIESELGGMILSTGVPLAIAELDHAQRNVEEWLRVLLPLAMFVGSWVALRSPVLALVPVSLGILTAGLTGWMIVTVLGSVNLVTGIAGPLALAIVTSSTTQVLTRALAESGTTEGRAPTTVNVWIANRRAAVTTVIGFLVLAISPIKAVHDLGVVCALAISIGVVLSRLVLARLLHEWDWSVGYGFQQGESWLQRIPAWACTHRRVTSIPCIGVVVMGAAGLCFVPRDADLLQYVGARSAVRDATERLADAQVPLGSLEVLVESAQKIVLNDIDELARTLEAVEGVRSILWSHHSGALLDFLRTSEARTFNRLSGDGRVARLTVRSDTIETGEMQELASRLALESARWRKKVGERVSGLGVTGSTLRIGLLQHEITQTLWCSMAVSAVVLVVIGWWVAGSVTELTGYLLANGAGMLAPLAIAFGAGLQLDAASVMVVSIVGGIVVDNTIHVLSAARGVETGCRSERVSHAYAHVGRSAVFSSIAGCIGFALLAFSTVPPVAKFGLLAACGLAVGLAASMLVLPSYIDRRRAGST